MPAHPPFNLWIVPPSVPFQIPCPHCQNPLERGEYCSLHHEQGLMVLRQGPEIPLEEHQHCPFLFLTHIHDSDSTRATQGLNSLRTSPIDIISLLVPPVQHAHSLPAHPSTPSNIPARELRIHESMR